MKTITINWPGEIDRREVVDEYTPSARIIQTAEEVGATVRETGGTYPPELQPTAHQRVVRIWSLVDDEPSGAWNIEDLDANEILAVRSGLVIHAAQLREMLRRRGIKASVEGAIAAAPGEDGDILRDWYEFAPTIRRDSLRVDRIREELNISPETLDEWFAEAMNYQ
jgi:hypothetical protein